MSKMKRAELAESVLTHGRIYEEIVEIKISKKLVSNARAMRIHEAQKGVLHRAMILLQCEEFEPSVYEDGPYGEFLTACKALKKAVKSSEK